MGTLAKDLPNAEEVRKRMEHWRTKAGRVNAIAASRILETRQLSAVLASAFAHTSYLARCCLHHPDAVIEALTGNPEDVIAKVVRDLKALDRVTGPAPALSRAISPLKERAVVAIGLADLSGRWTTAQVGEALTELAEQVLEAGLAWLVRLGFRHGELNSGEDRAHAQLPGFFLLSSKDFAAREPGYSGPLDVLFVVDETVLNEAGIKRADRTFERIATDLSDAFTGLQDAPQIFRLQNGRRLTRTMRNLVVSTETALETLAAQEDPTNLAWFSNARVVAGDRASGERFLADVARWLWGQPMSADLVQQAVSPHVAPTEQPGFSGSAITDAVLRVTQAGRLALGRENADFRGGSSVSLFEQAARLGAIDGHGSDRMMAAAEFCQRVRNRLELIRGEANDAEAAGQELSALAALCGYPDTDLFDLIRQGCLAEAEQFWLKLITPLPEDGLVGEAPAEAEESAAEPEASVEAEDDAAGDDAAGDEASESAEAAEETTAADTDGDETGAGADDAETTGETAEAVEAQPARGLAQVQRHDVAVSLGTWLTGQYQPERFAATSRRLSEVAPGLLTEIGRTQAPQDAIEAFETLLGNLPSTIDPFLKIKHQDAFTGVVADLFGNAPRFGTIVAERRHLGQELFERQRQAPQIPSEWLSRFPAPSTGGTLEETRAAVDTWMWDMRARVAQGVISGTVPFADVGEVLSAVTDEAVRQIYEAAIVDARREGPEPGRGLSVIATGDYGGRILTEGAKLGLAFVYDPDGEDGPTAESVTYYNDLATAITEALAAEGPRGPLFVIDDEHRPGGVGAEPALSYRVYRNYFTGEVGAAELLTLASARVVCGPRTLTERVSAAIADLITRPRKATTLFRDADRARAHLHRPERLETLGDITRLAGGLEDAVMIAEALRLKHGAEHPYILTANPLDAFAAMSRAKCLDPDAADDLIETVQFYLRIRTILGLTGDIDLRREPPAARLGAMVANAAGVAGFRAVEPLIQGYADRVLAHYQRIIMGHETVPSLRAPAAAA